MFYVISYDIPDDPATESTRERCSKGSVPASNTAYLKHISTVDSLTSSSKQLLGSSSLLKIQSVTTRSVVHASRAPKSPLLGI